MEWTTYPAVPDGPLSRLMDDPAFWAEMFQDADDRKAAKRAVKRLAGRGGLGAVIKIERDDAIGRAIHALMSTPHGRHLLQQELRKRLEDYESDPRDMVAQVLYQNLAECEAWFSPLEKVLEEDRETGLRYLTPEGLARYLEAEGPPTDPEHQRWLAAMVSAFALVSRRDRLALLEALRSLGPPFEEMLGPPS